jgi:hypothetical protein
MDGGIQPCDDGGDVVAGLFVRPAWDSTTPAYAGVEQELTAFRAEMRREFAPAYAGVLGCNLALTTAVLWKVFA